MTNYFYYALACLALTTSVTMAQDNGKAITLKGSIQSDYFYNFHVSHYCY